MGTNKKVNVNGQTSLSSLGEIIAFDPYLSEEDIVDFIKQIDSDYGSWSLTEKLHKYFKNEMKQARKEGWYND